MEQKKSLKRNYIYNLFYQILAILVPLVTTPYVSRVLGPERIGDYSYTSSIVSYFGMVAVLGTVSYGQREIAACQKKAGERTRLFYELLFLRTLTASAVLAVYGVFLWYIEEYRILYLIQLCTVFSWVFDISWFFQGMEDFRVTVIRNSCVKILSVFLILLFVKKEEDLWLYTLIVCGTALVGNLTMWPFLKRYIRKPEWKELRPFRHFRGSMELFVPMLGIQVYTVLDQTMLGVMADTTQVGYYSQAQKVVKLASTVLYALTAVLMPRMSAVLAERNLELARKYYNKTIDFSMLLILPMLAGTFLIADYLVPVFLGDGYEACIPLLMILSLLYITQGIGQIAGTLLISMKRQNQYTAAVTAGAIFNLCANALLIPVCGAAGAAAASVAAELCVELIMLRGIRPEFDNGCIRRAFLRYLPLTAVMCAVIMLLKNILTVSLPSLLLLGAAAAGSYGVLLMLKQDPLIYEQYEQLKQRRKQK